MRQKGISPKLLFWKGSHWIQNVFRSWSEGSPMEPFGDWFWGQNSLNFIQQDCLSSTPLINFL
jgi:hypothetical protein